MRMNFLYENDKNESQPLDQNGWMRLRDYTCASPYSIAYCSSSQTHLLMFIS